MIMISNIESVCVDRFWSNIFKYCVHDEIQFENFGKRMQKLELVLYWKWVIIKNRKFGVSFSIDGQICHSLREYVPFVQF